MSATYSLVKQRIKIFVLCIQLFYKFEIVSEFLKVQVYVYIDVYIFRFSKLKPFLN